MQGLKVKVKMPDGKIIECKVLPVQTRKPPTCRKCHKEIRFAEMPNGKHIPIMAKEEQWYGHFRDRCTKTD